MKRRMSEKANKILYIILSLLLAVVFWLFVDASQGNQITQDFANVAVEFIGEEDTLPSRGLMLAEGGDATVTVKLRGPRSVISNLRSKDLRVRVNLTDINAVGRYSKTYELATPDNVNDNDITIERKTPNTLTVRVTNLYSREIPVTLDVVGSVDEPYVYMPERRTIEPAAITLSGLQNDVDAVASARVRVDITDADGTIRQEYAYELLDAEGNVIEDPDIRTSHQRVSVEVPIYMIKTLPLTVKFIESAGSRLANADCELEPSSITVAGDPLSLETLEEISMGEVNLSEHITDYEDDLEIKMPAECENISGTKTTHLSIRYHGLETKMIQVRNIEAVGLSESQHFDRITTSLNIMLRGPSDDLEQVTEEDIRAVVDLREFTGGTVNVSATIFVDGYTEVGAVGGPYEVSGKIITS